MKRIILCWACVLHTEALLETEFETKPEFRSHRAALKSVAAQSQIECAAVCVSCSGYNYHCGARDQCQLLCGGGNDTLLVPGWTFGYLEETTGEIIYFSQTARGPWSMIRKHFTKILNVIVNIYLFPILISNC